MLEPRLDDRNFQSYAFGECIALVSVRMWTSSKFSFHILLLRFGDEMILCSSVMDVLLAIGVWENVIRIDLSTL